MALTSNIRQVLQRLLGSIIDILSVENPHKLSVDLLDHHCQLAVGEDRRISTCVDLLVVVESHRALRARKDRELKQLAKLFLSG